MVIEKENIIRMLPQVLKRDESELLEINDATDLREHGLDSITSIELIVMLEDEFNISVEDEDLLIDNFNTVEKLMLLLDKYLKNS
ncbi:MAG: Phosphopantetheine attachment site [Eubacterium sp.]|jgi:acyl carrier protein|nr:Phosphopantetheine attachment site [Eubacterium sp.]